MSGEHAKKFGGPNISNCRVHAHPSVRLMRGHLSGWYASIRWAPKKVPIGITCQPCIWAYACNTRREVGGSLRRGWHLYRRGIKEVEWEICPNEPQMRRFLLTDPRIKKTIYSTKNIIITCNTKVLGLYIYIYIYHVSYIIYIIYYIIKVEFRSHGCTKWLHHIAEIFLDF